MSAPRGLPPEFDNTVRLFPLGDYVAFPHNVMPLHIFESRYREMFEDAMKSDQLITMATLEPGHSDEYFSRPPLHPVVCIGRVIEHETTSRGTYELMLQGIARARIESEIEPVRSFRRAHVSLIEESIPMEDANTRHLGARLTSLLKSRASSGQRFIDVIAHGNFPLHVLTDVAATYLQLPTEQKLQLLQEGDPVRRAEEILKFSGSRQSGQVASDSDDVDGRPPIDFSNN